MNSREKQLKTDTRLYERGRIGVLTERPISGHLPKFMTRSTFFILTLAVSWSGLTGCAGPTPALDGPAWGGGLVASVRSEPRTFNRLIARDSASSLVAELTQASLVRIDKVEDRVEPWLAESWTQSADGLSYVLHLRQDVRFSDGAPFTAEDVVFSFRAVYDETLASPLADALRINGKPIEVTASDDMTVVLTFPEPFSPGIRILDSLPMLPKHRLEDAFLDGSLADAWGVTTPLESMAGLGPFVLSDYRPGQRLVFARCSHVVIATFEPLCGKETVEVLGWQKHVFAVCG